MTLNRQKAETMIDALESMRRATNPTCKDELLLLKLRLDYFQTLLGLDDIGELSVEDLRLIDPIFVCK